jgi:hypothetical protein
MPTLVGRGPDGHTSPRVQSEGSLADVLLREPHYLSRRKHQTTGGKHAKFCLPASFP